MPQLVAACRNEGFDVTENLVKMAFDLKNPFLKRTSVESRFAFAHSTYYYGLTSKGFDYAQDSHEKTYQDLPYTTPLIDVIGNAPAADRVVPLNHNSAPYKDLTKKLDEGIEAVKNEFSNDFEDKEEVQAELEAGRKLLKAAKIRIGSIYSTLKPVLTKLKSRFVDHVIGRMATQILALLEKFIAFILN